MAVAGSGGPPPDDSFTYYSTRFDGTDDVERNAGLTGAADSKLGLISFWLKFPASSSDTNDYLIFINFNPSLRLIRTTAGDIRLITNDSASGYALWMDTVGHTGQVKADGWVHWLMSWDTSSSGNCKIYRNGVDNTHIDTVTVDAVNDYTATNWAFGACNTGTNPDYLLSEFYFGVPASYYDITNSTNREKFRSVNGLPVNLGSDGSIPTGTAPLVYMRNKVGGSPDFLTNQGTGGDFTMASGTLTDGGSDKPGETLWQYCDAVSNAGREPDTYNSALNNDWSQKIRCLETVQISKIALYIDGGSAGDMNVIISTDNASNGYGTTLGTSDTLNTNFDGHGGDLVARWVEFTFSTPVTVSSDFWFSPKTISGATRWYMYFNPGDLYMPGASPAYDVDYHGTSQPTVGGYIQDFGFRIWTARPAIDIINENFEGTGIPSNFYNGGAPDFDYTGVVLAGSQSFRIWHDGSLHYTLTPYPQSVNIPEVWTKMLVRIIAYSASGYIVSWNHTQNDFAGQMGSIAWNNALGISLDLGTWKNPFAIGTTYYLWTHGKKNDVFEIWWNTVDDRAGAAAAGDHLSGTGGNFNFGWLQMDTYGLGAEMVVDNVQIASTDVFA